MHANETANERKQRQSYDLPAPIGIRRFVGAIRDAWKLLYGVVYAIRSAGDFDLTEDVYWRTVRRKRALAKIPRHPTRPGQV